MIMNTMIKQLTLTELVQKFFIAAARYVSVRSDLTCDEKDSLIEEIAQKAAVVRKLNQRIEVDCIHRENCRISTDFN